MSKLNTLALMFVATLGFCSVSYSQEMDVDQADSLDFERFHSDKKNAIKIRGGKNANEPSKAYETKPTVKQQAETSPPTSATTVQEKSHTEVDNNTGKRFEIRELYSINGSTRTSYTPNTVVKALYLQMQGLCANGWIKQEERSVPDGDDYYLYYVFKCL